MVTAYEFNWLLKGWVAMALVIFAAMWAHLGYNIAFSWPAFRPFRSP